jgi:hypothetical protein
MPTKDNVKREQNIPDRDPVAEAARDRKNLIARKKRALERALGEVYSAERILQAWRDEENRLNSSRFHQISQSKELLEKRRGIVRGLKEELRALGVNVSD